MATPPKSIPRQAVWDMPSTREIDQTMTWVELRAEDKQTARITCRVCELPATVPIDHPALLCELCLEDLDKTRRYVAENIDAVLARLDKHEADWQAKRATSPAASQWLRVQDAMIGVAEKRVDKATFAAQWAKRKAEGGPLAALLVAYEAYDAATDQCGRELEKWHRAQVEINAAWLATEV